MLANSIIKTAIYCVCARRKRNSSSKYFSFENRLLISVEKKKFKRVQHYTSSVLCPVDLVVFCVCPRVWSIRILQLAKQRKQVQANHSIWVTRIYLSKSPSVWNIDFCFCCLCSVVVVSCTIYVKTDSINLDSVSNFHFFCVWKMGFPEDNNENELMVKQSQPSQLRKSALYFEYWSFEMEWH